MAAIGDHNAPQPDRFADEGSGLFMQLTERHLLHESQCVKGRVLEGNDGVGGERLGLSSPDSLGAYPGPIRWRAPPPHGFTQRRKPLARCSMQSTQNP